METSVLRIAVIDDHPFIAKGIAAMLGSSSGLEIAWSAPSAAEARSLLLARPVDVAIVDLKLGNANDGIGVLRFINESGLATKALVLSAYASPLVVRECSKWGALGFFCKTSEHTRLMEAIEQMKRGETPSFLGDFRHWATPNPCLELSRREREVLMELSRGFSNGDIADRLGLRTGTVKTHLESIFRKLEVSNRTDAVVEALAQGYFQLEELSDKDGH